MVRSWKFVVSNKSHVTIEIAPHKGTADHGIANKTGIELHNNFLLWDLE